MIERNYAFDFWREREFFALGFDFEYTYKPSSWIIWMKLGLWHLTFAYDHYGFITIFPSDCRTTGNQSEFISLKEE